VTLLSRGEGGPILKSKTGTKLAVKVPGPFTVRVVVCDNELETLSIPDVDQEEKP
jgi:hypothetical protein